MLLVLFILGCKNNNLKSDKNTLSKKSSLYKGYIKIDSIKIDEVTYDYEMFFYNKNKKTLINKIRNQDYSVEFKKKFSYSKDNFFYDCYDIVDLPTGLVWNILHDKNKDEVYETEKYDKEALGDTLDRNNVNFKEKYASVFSNYKNKSYRVSLKKIYPQKEGF